MTRSLIAIGAVACGLALVAGSASGGRAVAPSCRTSGLVVWIDTQGNRAAGSVFYHLELTNQSGHGRAPWPVIRECRPLTCAAASWGAQGLQKPSARRVVTLRNGASASAQLRIVQVLNYSRSVCRQVAAAGLRRVYPPNETVSKVVPFPFAACSRSGPVYLYVTEDGRREGGSRPPAQRRNHQRSHDPAHTAITAPIQKAVDPPEPGRDRGARNRLVRRHRRAELTTDDAADRPHHRVEARWRCRSRLGLTASTTSFAIAPKAERNAAARKSHSKHPPARSRSCHSASRHGPIAG